MASLFAIRYKANNLFIGKKPGWQTEPRLFSTRSGARNSLNKFLYSMARAMNPPTPNAYGYHNQWYVLRAAGRTWRNYNLPPNTVLTKSDFEIVEYGIVEIAVHP